MSRTTELARIHVLKKELGLDDDTYRDVVERVAGVRSSAKLDAAGRKQLTAQLNAMAGNAAPKAAKPYVRKVWAVWGELKRNGTWREPGRQSLIRFVERQTGKKSPDWLTFQEATLVIEALKKMGARG